MSILTFPYNLTGNTIAYANQVMDNYNAIKTVSDDHDGRIVVLEGSSVTTSDVTYANLLANGDIGIGATDVAQGDHTHPTIYYTKTELDSLTGKVDKVTGIDGEIGMFNAVGNIETTGTTFADLTDGTFVFTGLNVSGSSDFGNLNITTDTISTTGTNTDINIDASTGGTGDVNLKGTRLFLRNAAGTSIVNITGSTLTATYGLTVGGIIRTNNSYTVNGTAVIDATRKGIFEDIDITTASGIIKTTTANAPITIESDGSGNVILKPNTGYIDASTSLISNVLDPVSAQDASTRQYVDDQRLILNRTDISDTDYTMLATDETIAYTTLTASRTVTLSTLLSTNKRKITIKDMTGNSTLYPIIIDPESTATIDGQLTFTLSSAYSSITLFCDGTNWFTI